MRLAGPCIFIPEHTCTSASKTSGWSKILESRVEYSDGLVEPRDDQLVADDLRGIGEGFAFSLCVGDITDDILQCSNAEV